MKFLVSSHLPDDFDPSTIDEETGRAIHALNAEMEAAGALAFAGGLYPAGLAKTVRPQPDGKILVTDGPYAETKEHLGGFLILDAAGMDEALEWVRKGAIAGGRADRGAPDILPRGLATFRLNNPLTLGRSLSRPTGHFPCLPLACLARNRGPFATVASVVRRTSLR